MIQRSVPLLFPKDQPTYERSGWCTFESTAAGLVSIQVSLNRLDGYEGDFTAGSPAPVTYRFFEPPVASHLSPRAGPVRGGTSLTEGSVSFRDVRSTAARRALDEVYGLLEANWTRRDQLLTDFVRWRRGVPSLHLPLRRPQVDRAHTQRD